MVFERQIATATRLIAKYGQDCTWRKTVATGPASKPTGQNVTDYPVKIVFVNHKRESLLTALSMMTNTDIPSGGLLGLMAVVSFDPELPDAVIRGTEQYGIADKNGIEKLAPNGEGAILYKLRLVR